MIKNNRKIVLFNTWRVINSKGGTEKVFCDLSSEFANRGYEVYAFHCDSNKGTPGFFVSPQVHFIKLLPKYFWLFNACLKIFSWHPKKNIRRIQREKLRNYIISFFLSKRLSKIGNIDSLLCFTPEAAFIVKTILKLKVNSVMMFHFSPKFFLEDEVFVKLYKKSIEEMEVVQVLLPEFKRDVSEGFSNEKIVVIPNVVPQYIYKADRTLKKIINVGRVCEHKGQLLLLQAFILLKDEFPDWELEFWGEDEIEPAVTKQIRSSINKHCLAGRVKLCGVTDCIERHLSKASIFAFPSKSEAFSLALTEAMSKGLAIVGIKNCSCVNSLIKHEYNGLLCEATVKDLAFTLRRLMSDTKYRILLGDAAKKEMKKYSKKEIIDQWETII